MNLGTHMPNGERRKPIDIEVCRSKALSIHMFATRLSQGALLIFFHYPSVWQGYIRPLSYKPQYHYASSSHHQACVYQVSFRSNISFLRYYAETNKISNLCSIFRSCDYMVIKLVLFISRIHMLLVDR
jgi:hypothetical protein